MKIKIRQKDNYGNQNDIYQVIKPEIFYKKIESVYSGNQQDHECRISGINGSASENSGQEEMIMVLVFNKKKVIIEETHYKGHGQ